MNKVLINRHKLHQSFDSSQKSIDEFFVVGRLILCRCQQLLGECFVEYCHETLLDFCNFLVADPRADAGIAAVKSVILQRWVDPAEHVIVEMCPQQIQAVFRYEDT